MVYVWGWEGLPLHPDVKVGANDNRPRPIHSSAGPVFDPCWFAFMLFLSENFLFFL
jgi:hypothetical protein